MTSRTPSNNGPGNTTEEAHEYASSPCAWAEADPAYHGFLNIDELRVLLNDLLADVRTIESVSRDLARTLTKTRLRKLLEAIARNQALCCALLMESLRAMGIKPIRDLKRAVDQSRMGLTAEQELDWLIRHQQRIVESLNRSLARVHDSGLHANLKRVRDHHLDDVTRTMACADRAYPGWTLGL